jgi:deoxyhypusine monooxygenase
MRDKDAPSTFWLYFVPSGVDATGLSACPARKKITTVISIANEAPIFLSFSKMTQTTAALQKALCSEATPLSVRFRSLFSLKHIASHSTGDEALAAIAAIAAAFTSPSALLKHELAYCLGQTGNHAAVPYLQGVLEDLTEDPMCRHEAAEALGALGDGGSLDILRRYRDRQGEEVVVTETCEIAIDRIEWAQSEASKREKLRHRFVF